MSGARLATMRLGDSSELLAEFILGTMAFCTKVPREKDVGHDLMCVLYEKDENDNKLLRSGPFFTVQVKSNRRSLVYKKTHQISWIMHQEAPFFLAVVNRKKLEMELYSTWNMWNGFLYYGARRGEQETQEIRLVPNKAFDESSLFEMSADGVLKIPLGKPILCVCAADVTNPKCAKDLAAILKEWILLDRDNQALNKADMYWVTGPTSYETNELPPPRCKMPTKFYWEQGNLEQCGINFGLVAPHLRLVLEEVPLSARDSKYNERVEVLNHALTTFADYLKPGVIEELRKRVSLKFPGALTSNVENTS